MERDSIIISGIYVVTDDEGLGVFVEVPRVDGKTDWRRAYKGKPPCKCPASGTLVQPATIRQLAKCNPFHDEEASDDEK